MPLSHVIGNCCLAIQQLCCFTFHRSKHNKYLYSYYFVGIAWMEIVSQDFPSTLALILYTFKVDSEETLYIYYSSVRYFDLSSRVKRAASLSPALFVFK